MTKKKETKTAKEPVAEEGLMGTGIVKDSSGVTEEIVQDRRDMAIDVKCEKCDREFKMEMPDIRER
ncbi:hypothetical protein KAR91_26325, partial [Candidatus Pacearchaeota archaeon]|nr:hypothetical protein [Candidatus Pacearchaeota archaeon]